jgi:hypothetical protein
MFLHQAFVLCAMLGVVKSVTSYLEDVGNFAINLGQDVQTIYNRIDRVVGAVQAFFDTANHELSKIGMPRTIG